MPDWLERAKEVYLFHADKVRNNTKWTITKTANMLGWSVGKVCEDLLVVEMSRAYPQMEKLQTRNDAIMWAKAKRKEIRFQV
jgi:hypothetical protein